MAGGARGKPFKSRHNALDMDFTCALLRALFETFISSAALRRFMRSTVIFRNEGISTRHNPEFTMLEVYQSYGNFEDMMQLTEELVSSLVL